MAADGRQKSLDFLARSFSDAVGRGDAGPSGPLEEAWAEVVAGGLARRLEAAAWRWASSGHDVGRPYRQKIRFLAGTLKRPESEQLLQKALRFEVSASELVARPEEAAGPGLLTAHPKGLPGPPDVFEEILFSRL
ncbi:unnamed protein product [Durusdinium trenchii]|uniref:Selenoprotein O n=1 Tax=Durusdinium trenchii TaxID=1381693 RepID=A0ABP0MXR1_9DINO